LATAYNGLALVSGVPRGSAPYDNSTTLIAGVTAGTAVTLPGSESFTSLNQLKIRLNGQVLDPTAATPDYAVSGSSPYTAVTFAQNLVTGDVLEFRIETSH
jgi:hypothetical protein